MCGPRAHTENQTVAGLVTPELSVSAVGPSRDLTDYARRRPQEATLDAGSIPATSTRAARAHRRRGAPSLRSVGRRWVPRARVVAMSERRGGRSLRERVRALPWLTRGAPWWLLLALGVGLAAAGLWLITRPLSALGV